MADKKSKLCSNCGVEMRTTEKLCPSCRKGTQVSSAQEANKSSIGLPQKIEWQIGEGHFHIDKHRASYTAPTKNPLTKHSEEIGSLITTYGLVKGSPGITTVGATTMSQPNRNEKGWTVRWKDVREVKFNPEKHMVMLKEKLFTGGLGGGLGTIHIYCTPENYETVALACQAFQSRTQQTNRRSESGSP